MVILQSNSIRTDLTYIRDHYAVSPEYLKINGKFVVFVYGSDSDNCNMVKRWTDLNTVNAYLVLKIFVGYKKCTQQPDAWHQYSPAVSQRQVGTDSFIISPGFALAGKENILLTRDIERWKSDIQTMTASNANFQLITNLMNGVKAHLLKQQMSGQVSRVLGLILMHCIGMVMIT